MINKILGRKDKGSEVFHIPDKKYCHDSKKLFKMQKKDLMDEIEHMEKYISIICNKLEEAKKQYQKTVDKLDQTVEKLNVVNSKMAMINNQHEELQVKFSNLSNSLQILSKEKQTIYKNQMKFLETKQLVKQKIPDLPSILVIYHDQILLVEKIAHQNKQLKQKYTQLEADFFALSDKITDPKNKAVNDEAVNGQGKSKQIEETQPDDDKNNQYKLLAETKEQMIGLLNKKIAQNQDKISELQEKLSDLNHQIDSKSTSIRQKEQELSRYMGEVNEYKKKINELKQFQQEMLITQQRLQSTVKKQQLQLQRQNYDIKELANKLKFSQEKNILISAHQTGVNESNSNQTQLQMARLSHELETKDMQINSLRQRNSEFNLQIQQLIQDLKDLKAKDKNMEKLQQKLNQQIQQKAKLNKKLEDQEESYQIRLKKFQFNLNQQRIKTDALKRSLSNLQLKEEESQKLLNQMYEQKVVNDNKVAKMESKLKSYKQMIQYLQKEKVEMEKTFEDKIKNMEEIVVNDSEADEDPAQSDHSERQTIQQEQVIISKLNRKIVDLEEQIEFLKEENRALSNQKGQLEVSNLELQKNVKLINDKRHEMLKQLNKMSSIGASDSNPLNNKPSNTMVQSRQKKVAEKALKGFDIMSKNLSALYKQFLNVHLADIQKKPVKDMEGSINLLVGKCQDMKDIFQGYL